MRKFWLVATVLLATVALLTVSCTSDTSGLEQRLTELEQERTSLQQQVTSLHDQALHSNMIATLNLLDDVGFHHINEAIRTEQEAPAGTYGKVRTALRAVAVSAWPDELRPGAQDLQQKLQRFVQALRGDDQGTLLDTAQQAHDTYHEFTRLAWEYLAEQAGLDDTSAPRQHDKQRGAGTTEHNGDHDQRDE